MGFGDRFRQSMSSVGMDLFRPAFTPVPAGTRRVNYGGGEHLSQVIADQKNPYAFLWRARTNRAERQLYGGMDSNGPVMLEADTNCLVVAPARSPAGKTASIVIPNVLMFMGPVIATSTKADVLRATAIVRSALGTCWHYRPDDEPLAPGATDLRWSPVHAVASAPTSKQWGLALDMIALMLQAADRDVSRSDNAQHFKDRASSFLAVLIFYAAVFGKDQRWVVMAVFDATAKGLTRVVAELETAGHEIQSSILANVLGRPEKERESIFSTAAVALRPYERDSALASTDNPNFDMAAFVRGRPFEYNPELELDPATERDLHPSDRGPVGYFDTVYITADRQALLAPLIVAFLTHARNEAQRYNSQDQYTNPSPKQPVLFALDEMGTMAPLPDLPEMLAKGGTGVVTLGVLQDMSQARQRWGEEGMGLATLFQNIILCPGLADRETLELFSMLAGEFERLKHTYNSGTSTATMQLGATKSQGYSYTWERFPRLPVDVIASGRRGSPLAVLLFRHGARSHEWVNATPYYRSTPWPQMIVKAVGKVVAEGAHAPRIFYPFPFLDRDGIVQDFGKKYVDAYLMHRQNWPILQARELEQPRASKELSA